MTDVSKWSNFSCDWISTSLRRGNVIFEGFLSLYDVNVRHDFGLYFVIFHSTHICNKSALPAYQVLVPLVIKLIVRFSWYSRCNDHNFVKFLDATRFRFSIFWRWNILNIQYSNFCLTCNNVRKGLNSFLDY